VRAQKRVKDLTVNQMSTKQEKCAAVFRSVGFWDMSGSSSWPLGFATIVCPEGYRPADKSLNPAWSAAPERLNDTIEWAKQPSDEEREDARRIDCYPSFSARVEWIPAVKK
jgi:hypothetical protein